MKEGPGQSPHSQRPYTQRSHLDLRLRDLQDPHLSLSSAPRIRSPSPASYSPLGLFPPFCWPPCPSLCHLVLCPSYAEGVPWGSVLSPLHLIPHPSHPDAESETAELGGVQSEAAVWGAGMVANGGINGCPGHGEGSPEGTALVGSVLRKYSVHPFSRELPCGCVCLCLARGLSPVVHHRSNPEE